MDIWTRLAQFTFFETERMMMRPFIFSQDNSWFYDVASNPQNVPYIFPVTVSKRESDYLLVHSFIKEPLGIWALECLKTHQVIGMIRLEKVNSLDLTAEVSYFTHLNYWGKGYMTEALKTLAFLSFHELGLKKLTVITHQENLASQKVAQKAGFKLTRAFKGSDRYTKKTRQYLQFELSKGDYRYE